MTPVANRVAGKIKKSLGRALRKPLQGCAKFLGVDLNPMSGLYERLYEAVAQSLPADVSIGEGKFDLIGRIELGVLIMEGLAPHHTLCDFGCGTGRLAVHAVPYLAAGRYIGTDISESMLASARERLSLQIPKPSAEVVFVKQRPDMFDVPDASVDFVCAFSGLYAHGARGCLPLSEGGAPNNAPRRQVRVLVSADASCFRPGDLRHGGREEI